MGSEFAAGEEFEGMVTAQASRLVDVAQPDAAALALLTADDLEWPQELADALPVLGTPRYRVVCPGFGKEYSWAPDLAVVEAQCTKCQAIYDASFGEVIV